METDAYEAVVKEVDMRPIVSIVIPCYNQGQWLLRAVESALKSTYSPIEVIVIDDGSTDGVTKDVLDQLKDSRIRIIRQKNKGVCFARNTAIELSTGEYVLTLDGDDELAENFIAKAMEVFFKCPEVCQVGGNYVYLMEDGVGELQQSYSDGYVTDLIMSNNFIPNTYLFRKSIWAAVGGFSVDLNRLALEDVDFTMRLHALGCQTFLLHECACLYRQHGESRNNHNMRRIVAKLKIIGHNLRWYLCHLKYLLPFLMWRHFSWMVVNMNGTRSCV